MPSTLEQQALDHNDRYLLEFVETLNLCPFARGCREAGRLYRRVEALAEPDPAQVARVVGEAEGLPEPIEVVLLIFPQLSISARDFERLVSEVRNQVLADPARLHPFFLVAFHPGLPQDLATPDRAVAFLRRSPDPTIQMVRASAIAVVQDAAGDKRAPSLRIAEAGLAAVHERGPERLAQLLGDFRAMHRG